MSDQAHDILYRLPRELFHEIISYLSPVDFANFTFAHYNLLRLRGIAPLLSINRIADLLAVCSLRGHESTTMLHRLPNELLLHTMGNMRPAVLVNFVFAFYHPLRLRGLAPPLSPKMSPQFKRAWNVATRRSGSTVRRGWVYSYTFITIASMIRWLCWAKLHA
ncbi:MAG: hypothetical protein M1833_006601 [Piccolia ochrophora]|nr:MAG: hypothetical protein M1833_006601 [Piccolia ochrophora]